MYKDGRDFKKVPDDFIFYLIRKEKPMASSRILAGEKHRSSVITD
jgi:hypothetical protein